MSRISLFQKEKNKGGHETQVFIGYVSRKFHIYKLDLIKYKVKLHATKKLLLEIIHLSFECLLYDVKH